MTYISQVNRIADENHRKFVASRLRALKRQLTIEIQDKTEPGSLRLATWNLAHFGDGGAYQRETEAMHFIAEIIDQFDLVAIQEVNHNLDQFKELVKSHLGSDWDYLTTDASGNRERLVFLFRTSRVWFDKEAGEIVLPEGQEIVSEKQKDVEAKVQFARTPFAVTFQAGWLRFKIVTVHIFYGDSAEDSPQMKLRRDEIDKIAQFMAKIQTDAEADEKKKWLAERKARSEDDRGRSLEFVARSNDANIILLGDFNIISPQHDTMLALLSNGFVTSENMATAGTSISGKHHYDQIVFKMGDWRVGYGNSGVYDIFSCVYRDEDA